MAFRAHINRWFIINALATALLLLAGGSTSFAGILAGLSSTNFAFNGSVGGEPGHDAGYWRGSDSYSGVGGTYSNTVEFAVFEPGGSFGLFLGQPDPTSGVEWVYAFQARIDSDLSGTGLFALNAGFDTGAGVNSIGWVSGTGDDSPSVGLFNVNSAEWNWGSFAFTTGDVSDVLYYTSSFAPKKDFTSTESAIGDQGQSLVNKFASPSDLLTPDSVIPEPTSALLFIAGSVLLAFGKRRRSR